MIRRSLFWKIFLSFWVSMMLFGICSALIDDKIRQSELEYRYTPVSVIINRSYELIKQDSDKTALKNWLLESQDRIQSNTVYILDSSGGDLLQRPLNSRIRQAIHDSATEPQEITPYLQAADAIFFDPYSLPSNNIPALPDPEIIVIKLVSNSGIPFTLIIDNKSNRDNWIFWRTVSITTRIGIALLLSGIICSFLARYLTTPLLKLRLATHRIASGHFDSSMNKKFARRDDEIGDLGRDFSSMSQRIEATLQSQQRLLRDVSHELRSPLTRLQIALGLAYQRSDTAIQPELQRIEKEVDRLNELISQSLSLARISSQTNIPEKTPINLTELVKDVIDNVEYEARDKHCHIITAQLNRCEIHGNYDLLYSGVENILRNAIHHTNEDTEISINVIVSNTPETYACINVCDQGPGVPEEDIEAIFKPFYQVDEARSQQNSGYGIGLAIAQRAIQLHDGTIHITNIPEGGLEVTIKLPILKTSV